MFPTGTVTFLFSDIEGSTRLLQRVGDGYPEILEAHAKLIRQALAAHAGHEVSTEGDGFFAVFPIALDAVLAAAAVQRSLLGHPWPEGVQVRVRIGLHTGQGTLGGDDYVGLDVHRTARIASAAHGGQVLLSEATEALTTQDLPADLRLRDLGPHRLKDLEHPERLFQLVVAGLEQDFPPPRALDARPHNLPTQLTTFVGREKELAELQDLLGQTRLITITGAGGTGKSRLVLELASSCLSAFPQGVFFVPLATINDPALVLSAVAATLGVQVTGGTPLKALSRELATDRLLLVLDNFEQLAAAAPSVAELLEAVPGLHVVVTSRVLLRVRGEHAYPLSPLDVPDPSVRDWTDLAGYGSIRLFVDRAWAKDPSFVLTPENASVIAELAARLDGLPLAIELAASRIKLLPPKALLSRLGDRLDLLKADARDIDPRHQTLRSAIAWSHDLLDESGRALFRRLGLFEGGFTLDAAEFSAEGPPVESVLEGVAELLDNSLLFHRTVRGEARFEMLETIREFALEHLRRAGEEEALAGRHAEFFEGLAARAEPHLTRERQALWLDRLENDHGNLRAVLSRAPRLGRTQEALQGAGALWRFWQMRGHLGEGRGVLAELLARPEAAQPSPARAKALTGLAGLLYWQGDYAGSSGCYQEALEIYRHLADEWNTAEALYGLGAAAGMLGNHSEAERLLDEAVTIFGRLGDATSTARVLSSVGWVLMGRGRLTEATGAMQEALRLLEGTGERYMESQTRLALAWAHLGGRHYDEARVELVQAVESFAETGDLTSLAHGFRWMATIEAAAGSVQRAVRLTAAAERLRTSLGGGPTMAVTGLEEPDVTARRVLDQDEFDREWAEGEAMTLEQAVACAREALVDRDHTLRA
jgi:predicted ATPase/class 3 adenylate cyclase/Flp pilus assembly protein TadD